LKFEASRGTHDILPAEQPRWQQVIREFEQLCALYGYQRVDTPVFEDTELFRRTSGEGSDVVRKEMYTFIDRGDRSLTLRAEATAPIVRAYLQHGLHREPQPVKLYAIETIYRYGRPGKGRFREHWQLDLEALGSDDPAVDAEVIQLYDTLLSRLRVTEYRLELNSIGDPNCRPAYLEQLRTWLKQHEGELDEDTREQAGRNPLRVLDNLAAKSRSVQEVLRRAPTIGDSLCGPCREHFEGVREYLEAYGVEYELVPTLVRGLDYYTRTTWEFVGPGEGANSTISGGGRYDYLAEELGGPHTPGVGFGAGIERLQIAVDREDRVPVEQQGIDVFLLIREPTLRPAALAQMTKLRRAGLRCDTDYAGRSAKGQLTQASRLNARWLVDVGQGGVLIESRVEGELTNWPPYQVSEIAEKILERKAELLP
jgi:histidyl-tRNA synthetase